MELETNLATFTSISHYGDNREFQFNDALQVGNIAANSGGQSRPVATKAPNELGLHDMNGNVWELVSQADCMGGGWSTQQASLDRKSTRLNSSH